MDSEPENFDKLHQRAFSLIGSFTAAQFSIDYIVHRYLETKMPALGPVLTREFLERVRDDQRLTLFKALAEDCAYPGDLTNFDPIFNRAKQVRDLLAHSAGLNAGPFQRGKTPAVTVVTYTGVSGKSPKRPLVPKPLMPSHLDQLKVDIAWVSEHVYFLGQQSGIIKAADLAGNPRVLPQPPALPVGGMPL